MSRPASFVLVSTNHGTMIVNRNDYSRDEGSPAGFGIGYSLLTQSELSIPEMPLLKELLRNRRESFGDGLIAIDGGANIGIFTVELAKYLDTWGSVIAFEVQEPIFYALAGNLVLNNCMNAKARLCALSDNNDGIEVPILNYSEARSYGSLELIAPHKFSDADLQSIHYCNTVKIPSSTLDSLQLSRLDFLKLDIEGMESYVLYAGKKTLLKHRPIIYVELYKCNDREVVNFLNSIGYNVVILDINGLAIHKEDSGMEEVRQFISKHANTFPTYLEFLAL